MGTEGWIDAEPRAPGVAGLRWLVIGLLLGPVALSAIAGPPHLPAELPTWETIGATLRSSSLPPEVVVSALTTAAWGVWLWLVATLALHLTLAIADALTHGAAWVRALRAVSDRVTLPIVRRLADATLVAFLVVTCVARSPAVAATERLPPAAVTLAVGSERAADQTPPPASHEAKDQPSIEYTVQPGDSLWALAERFSGAGERWPDLFAANRHRPQPNGRRLENERRIFPGWILRVAVPNAVVEEEDGALHYVVRPGDTLRGIAARLLGDEARWSELFDLNRGRASLPDGRVLTDPDLIWPDLRLRLPQPAHAGPVQSAPATSSSAAPETPNAPAVRPSPAVPTEQPPPPDSPPPGATIPPSMAPPTEPALNLTPEVVTEPLSGSQDGAPSPFVLGAASVAAAAAAGSAMFLARRRVRRGLRETPVAPPTEPSPPPGDDFAEADPARALAHRLYGGEAEPVVLMADHAQRFLDEQGVPAASVVLAYQGRNAVTLVLDTPLLDQARVLDLAGPFAVRLGGSGQAAVTAGRDVHWRVSRLKAARLPAPPVVRGAVPPPLLALGLAPYDETLSVDWRALGHVLVAGLPGGGAEVVLATLGASLAARYRPDELRLWTIATRQTLAGALADLPHQERGFVAPDDEVAAGAVLETLRAVVAARLGRRAKPEGQPWRPSVDEPEHVLVVGELGELRDDGTTLELLGTDGPSVGVRLLTASVHAPAVGHDLLAHFGTRLVLQTLDDDESVHLLGRPEAADLGPGELFVQVEGRTPIRVRGFRVPEDHLAALVRLMREAQPSPRPARESAFSAASAPEKVTPADDDAPPFPDPRIRSDEDVAPGPDPPPSSPPVVHAALAGGGQEREVPPETDLTRDDTPATEKEAETDEAEAAAGSDETGPLRPPVTSEHATSFIGHQGARAVGEAAAGPATAVATDATSCEGSLLQVCCLGGFVVRSADRELTPTGEEGASYKAWEVLAFLAAQPGGAAPKEKLLAALWLDISEERGAHRMRMAMVRLRGILGRQVPGLGPDVVRIDRHGTCRLDTTVVWSDAHQFWALCSGVRTLSPDATRAPLEEALALYHGDLLTSRATRFYEWVEARDDSGVSLRERYRDHYCWATQRLAHLYRRAGRPEQAVALYKRLLKAEPTLEDIARELYRTYGELGDLNALIREERHLHQALREAYSDPTDPDDDPESYEPESETVELFDQIRSELENRTAGGGAGGAPREG